MKKTRKIIPVFLAMAVCFVMMPCAVQVHAASKKAVTVVSEISYTLKTSDNDEATPAGQDTSIVKPKYKKGLLKSCETFNGKVTLLYDKNNRVKKSVLTEDGVSTTCKNKWKKGKLVNVSMKSKSIKSNISFKYKGNKIIKATEKGKQSDAKYSFTDKYEYKNGHVVKKTRKIDNNKQIKSYEFDKKGNMLRCSLAAGGEVVEKVDCNLAYKGGLVSEITTVYYLKGLDNPEEFTAVYKYKKIRVNKKDAKQIKEQQWTLVNQFAESFAWYKN